MTKLEKFIIECGSNEIDVCVICKYAFGKRDCINIKCPSYKELFEELNKPYKEEVEFTDDEKAILRNLPEEYNWIARDSNGSVFVYLNKPHKNKSSWYNDGDYICLEMYEHLFKQINFEDEEPVNFREVLENDEVC